ncbi:MAG: cell division protein ZapA [Ferruginibacter sp.]|nr:cell division protein ZapA [Ferruginibacter sp.]
MDNLIPLNIIIADRSYRIRANKEDEEVIRKTLKTINDKIIEFKTQFAGKDMQDYVSMVVIWYATQATNATALPNADISEALDKLEKILG